MFLDCEWKRLGQSKFWIAECKKHRTLSKKKYHIPSARMLEKLLSGDISLGVCTADGSDKGEVGSRKGTPKMNLNVQAMSHSAVGHYVIQQ